MTYAKEVQYAYSLDEDTIPYGQQFSIWGSLKDVPKGTHALIVRAGPPSDLAGDIARWREKFGNVQVAPTVKGLENFTIYEAFNSQVRNLCKQR